MRHRRIVREPTGGPAPNVASPRAKRHRSAQAAVPSCHRITNTSRSGLSGTKRDAPEANIAGDESSGGEARRATGLLMEEEVGPTSFSTGPSSSNRC
jgi:hypothetical protein